MKLVKINEAVEVFGISSRTLRYYEEKGLIWSQRPKGKVQRYYDETALERLKQILVLRKLQIPIKDIVAIFESEDMSTLTQSFVDKLDSLDVEIAALADLRKLVDDFLDKMLTSGVSKMSAIPLLYEETEKRLMTTEGNKGEEGRGRGGGVGTDEGSGKNEAISFERLSEVSRKALKLHDIRIIRLPSARMLTSRLKTGQVETLDLDKMQNLFADYGFTPTPGFHDCFYRKEHNDEWVMLKKIPDDYENQTPYVDERFQGGLYAVTSAFMEDMDDSFILLKDWVKQSEDFELEAGAEMIEEILPWDIAIELKRFQQDLYLPISYCGTNKVI